MSDGDRNSNEGASGPPSYVQATVADLNELDFEKPIAEVDALETFALHQSYERSLSEFGPNALNHSVGRVYAMLSAALSMYFKPRDQNEPFGAMFVFEGRRTAIPSDFRGAPLGALAQMATNAKNPVLRARLSDLCWLLDRKTHSNLSLTAINAYVEVVNICRSKFHSKATENDKFHALYDAHDNLKRALAIAHAIGWDKPESQSARDLVGALRQESLNADAATSVRRFSELDLDFGVSDEQSVGESLEALCRNKNGSMDVFAAAELWRLAARAFRLAKLDDKKHQCLFEASNVFADRAEKEKSAIRAAHFLEEAIALLGGVPNTRDRRKKLKLKLLDIQDGIPDE